MNLVTPTVGDLQDGMVKNADKLIKYFAVDMEDMDNFDHHLQMILIPRVPGTKGNKIVREVGFSQNLPNILVRVFKN